MDKAGSELMRLTVRLDEAVVQELDKYASLAGVTRTAFIQMAVVIGMRSLARQFAPELFVTAGMIEQMRKAGFSIPEGVDISGEVQSSES